MCNKTFHRKVEPYYYDAIKNLKGGISMKVAIIQMGVDFDKQKNLEKMKSFVHGAKASGADLAVLPEMFNCPYSNDYFADYAEEAGGESYTAISQAAQENEIYVVGGSIPERDGSDVYNTSFAFDRKGVEIARHRKVHLFDIDVAGGQRFFESETFKAGDNITVFDTEFGKMGLVICFDIRFPEICRLTALAGANVLFAPGAFNMTTGPMHWEILFRLRAVDNQLFTVGASPARDEAGVYVSYANSIAVDPWGKILYRAGAHECMEIVEFDLDEVQKVRAQIPLLSAMRDDVYTIKKR